MPILCIGENQDEYSKGRTEKKIKDQLTKNLFPLQNTSNKILIAYEPIYAIGSGIAVQNEHLQEVSLLIKELVRDNLGADLTLIYGGSVTSESARNLAKVDDIDGFLVGNASLDPKEFANIALSLK
jgi:triosephosphate isomerase